MSKLVVFSILIITIVPIAGYLLFAPTNRPEAETEVPLLPSPAQEPKEGDSPQCAVCRQITDTVPQAQCLQDFACQ